MRVQVERRKDIEEVRKMLPMIAMEQEVMEAINGWTFSHRSSQDDAEGHEAGDRQEEDDQGTQWRSFITIICGETGEDDA